MIPSRIPFSTRAQHTGCLRTGELSTPLTVSQYHDVLVDSRRFTRRRPREIAPDGNRLAPGPFVVGRATGAPPCNGALVQAAKCDLGLAERLIWRCSIKRFPLRLC